MLYTFKFWRENLPIAIGEVRFEPSTRTGKPGRRRSIGESACGRAGPHHPHRDHPALEGHGIRPKGFGAKTAHRRAHTG